ncbi:MAG: hypothetical protein ACI9MR_004866, partial [Myxococcota bacterium]
HATFAEQSADRVAVVDNRACREPRAKIDQTCAVERTTLVPRGKDALALRTEEVGGAVGGLFQLDLHRRQTTRRPQSAW